MYEYVFERYDQMGEKALQLLKQQFQHRPSYELYKKRSLMLLQSVIVPYQHRLPAFLDEWKKRGGE
ncbi:hypothetical protein [Bacillus alveayuensis]|uniref:Uncharacterized protein n=1 Tax=Aeribacillus alveayuensis TaxID=279215 RepID=A0ABT9VQQ4_9BACI|nr:hypothetical protein [Bacillus alveayuensis]MDQ0163315.1 hypothetical protein [Bacillus alveayuensis]